jgi:3-oxoacyl-[acyl-carrier-protein] synthase-3
MDYTDRNTCVLFGDGAGAIVLGECEPGYGVIGIDLGADGSGGEFLSLPAGGSRMPASAETVAAKKHTVHMNGPEVFKFAIKIMGESAIKAIERAGLTPADVDLFIPHQANIRIIQSAAKRLKLPKDKVVINLDKYGNTSSASIPLALREAIDDGRVKKGDTIVAVGFGAGLTWASCVIKWAKEEKTIA